MAYASYPDQPHRGLPIPMWILLFGIVLTVILTAIIILQGSHAAR